MALNAQKNEIERIGTRMPEFKDRLFLEISNRDSSKSYDPLQDYRHEIKGYRLLSREEEIELAIRYREEGDEEAGLRLVTSNLRLVVKIAGDYQRYWSQSFLDLIQEGNLGLIQAAGKFDPYRGVKFSYYASFWIKAYIMKYIIDNWKMVKIGTTQNYRKLFFSLAREREKIIAQGQAPEPRLLAERLNVSEEDVIEMAVRLKKRDLPLNAALNEDSKAEHLSFLTSSEMTVDERLSRTQRKHVIFKKLKKFRKQLSDRAVDILDNRIMADDPATLQELGDKYRISRERVRQIQMKTIQNMKKWMQEEIPDFKEVYGDMR